MTAQKHACIFLFIASFYPHYIITIKGLLIDGHLYSQEYCSSNLPCIGRLGGGAQEEVQEEHKHVLPQKVTAALRLEEEGGAINGIAFC